MNASFTFVQNTLAIELCREQGVVLEEPGWLILLLAEIFVFHDSPAGFWACSAVTSCQSPLGLSPPGRLRGASHPSQRFPAWLPSILSSDTSVDPNRHQRQAI